MRDLRVIGRLFRCVSQRTGAAVKAADCLGRLQSPAEGHLDSISWYHQQGGWGSFIIRHHSLKVSFFSLLETQRRSIFTAATSYAAVAWRQTGSKRQDEFSFFFTSKVGGEHALLPPISIAGGCDRKCSWSFRTRQRRAAPINTLPFFQSKWKSSRSLWNTGTVDM